MEGMPHRAVGGPRRSGAGQETSGVLSWRQWSLQTVPGPVLGWGSPESGTQEREISGHRKWRSSWRDSQAGNVKITLRPSSHPNKYETRGFRSTTGEKSEFESSKSFRGKETNHLKEHRTQRYDVSALLKEAS